MIRSLFSEEPVAGAGDSAEGPAAGCPLCPRLVDFRSGNRESFPTWHNNPVPSFGSTSARFLVVGLAPGLKGANRTGRPFTGDYAGDLLYPTLIAHGFATGTYQAKPDDGLQLVDCRITNAVRCVPPENKPTGAETGTCQGFLVAEIQAMPGLEVILSLGSLSHGAVLGALGVKKSAHRFAHGAMHPLPNGRRLIDSYHCSRYNTNTGRLTPEMFHEVFRIVRRELDQESG